LIHESTLMVSAEDEGESALKDGEAHA
jgi:hypothetical protein